MTQQPQDEAQRHQAMQALLSSCPTASIGTVEKPREIQQVQQQFPLPVTANIYHCGYHSQKSFGAASYFIQRPEGNVLIDSPRFSLPLVKQLEAMGGVRYLYLTHRDDVADHAEFQAHFSQTNVQWNPDGQRCDRILHANEINSGTAAVELQPNGNSVLELAPISKSFPYRGIPKATPSCCTTTNIYSQATIWPGLADSITS